MSIDQVMERLKAAQSSRLSCKEWHRLVGLIE